MQSVQSGAAVAEQPTQELTDGQRAFFALEASRAEIEQYIQDFYDAADSGRATATPQLLLGAAPVYRPRHTNRRRRWPRVYSYNGRHREADA